MSTVLVIVAVVAVVAIAAWAMTRRRPSPVETGVAEVGAVEPPAAVVEEERAAVPAAPEQEAAPEQVEEPVVEPVPVKAQPSEAELRARVEANLAESSQMLEELRERSGEAAGSAQPASSGTLEIMTEGLAEVRGLAEKKEWSQARDKADALHAQLKLLLQAASRGSSS